MGEQFNQRYPNGVPLQNAAMQINQGPYGAYKPPVGPQGQQPAPLTNGQSHSPHLHQQPSQQPYPQQQQTFPGTQRYPTQTKPNSSPYQTVQPVQNPLNYGPPRPSSSFLQPGSYPGPTNSQTNQVPQVPSAGQQFRGPPPSPHPQPSPSSHPRPPPSSHPQPHPTTQHLPAPPVQQLQPHGLPPTNYPQPPPPVKPQQSSHLQRYGVSPSVSQSGPLPSSGLHPPPPNGAGGSAYSSGAPSGRMPPSAARPALPNQQYGGYSQPGLVSGMERMSVTQQGFNRLWGTESIDLLQCKNVLPPHKVTPPPVRLTHEFLNAANCNPDIFSCTLNKVPETNSLLQKSRLPLGVLIHPFKDLTELPVIQCSQIVRCRSCRTYINPFVYFFDNKRWKCNLCFRANDLPDEFQYDPVSKTYGDPSRRPEIKSCTIEFIAPAEYMLRPPPPAVYLFVMEVSRWGCDSGYITTLCGTLLEELDSLPGDTRTQVGFILFDSYLHFFSITDGANQARELIVTDIEDVFLPTPDSLLINLHENKAAIKELLEELPRRFAESFDIGCALGPALQAAHQLVSPTGGRVSLFQSSLPNRGSGTLKARESSGDSDKDGAHLGPQTDFYKRLALDCSSQQIAVDLFLVNSQHADLATVGGISQFSGGCIYHFPQFRVENVETCEKFTRALRRYLTRKIGLEAVLRVRCSRGLAVHTFHGNFFVRSTDLLSLPNVNPDAGFGMQISIEESLSELHSVCFQAALLYTSAKGERRIRVHTICLPVATTLTDVLTSANQQAIVGLIAKMAVDRSLSSKISDAREAFINACIDILSSYKLVSGQGGGLVAPNNLALIPLYILALIKSTAFRSGSNVRLDDRMFSMIQMKNLPLKELIQQIYPDLYNVTLLEDDPDKEGQVLLPAHEGLSFQFLDTNGAYILDTPDVIYLIIGQGIHPAFLSEVLGVSNTKSLGPDVLELPEVETAANIRLRSFINTLQNDKSYPVVVRFLTQPTQWSHFFVHDKAENALSYHELLNHIKSHVK